MTSPGKPGAKAGMGGAGKSPVEIPVAVRGVSLALALYGTVMVLGSVPLVLTGSFSGLHVLIPGLVNLVLGLMALRLTNRIERPVPRVRVQALVWSIIVASLLLVLAIGNLSSGTPQGLIGGWVLVTITLPSVWSVVTLLRPGIRKWYLGAPVVRA